MYLGSYRFDGDPDTLAAAYDTLMAGLPAGQLLWHICVRTESGLTVYDSCPDRREFVAFSTSPDVLGAMAAAGLPRPVVTEIGEIHRALAPGGIAVS